MNTYEAPKLMDMFPAYYMMVALLYLLQVMHVIWFYIIVRAALKSAVTGKVDKDERSESDNESEYQIEIADENLKETKNKKH